MNEENQAPNWTVGEKEYQAQQKLNIDVVPRLGPYPVTVTVEFKNHSETPSGWTQDWTITGHGDPTKVAEEILRTHETLLNGPQKEEK